MSHLPDKNLVTGETKTYLLSTLLENSKKSRIKAIAERYGVRLSDKNTKQQMMEAALPAIEVGFGIKMKQYSNEELQLVMNCFTEAEIDSATALRITASDSFKDGAVFLMTNKDRFFTAVPHELAGKLMAYCVSHVNPSSDADRESDRLAVVNAACSAIYGSFTPKMFADAANGAYSLGITEREAEDYLTTVTPAAVASGSFEIRAEAAGLAPYLPTRSETESYASYGADSKNYYYRQIVNFIYNNVGITYDNASILIRHISEWCLSDGEMGEVFKMVQESGLTLDADKFNHLLGMIGELSIRTHKPCLRGHKPEDVPGIKPLVIPGVQVASVKSTPVRVEKKIGRNDPCPCGSGKKYKKCCGKDK